jgi:hypothetical protein
MSVAELNNFNMGLRIRVKVWMRLRFLFHYIVASQRFSTQTKANMMTNIHHEDSIIAEYAQPYVYCYIWRYYVQ